MITGFSRQEKTAKEKGGEKSKAGTQNWAVHSFVTGKGGSTGCGLIRGIDSRKGKKDRRDGSGGRTRVQDSIKGTRKRADDRGD